jgi:GH15 family glucan-1,4-alpha-glucosidase
MTFLGQVEDVRNGIEYMLGFQHKNGSVLLMDSHWKETGIVLWVIKRHAQLTGDKKWLESKWDNVTRAVGYIDSMRMSTMKDKNAPNYGLIPAGFSDGGLSSKTYEFTNVYWTLNGLKSAVDIAIMLNRGNEAKIWKEKYDSMFADYQVAAKRSLKTDSCGNKAVPIYIVDSCQIQRGQWAFCHAIFPGKIFSNDDPLMIGTMNMLKCNEREGLVYETGWQNKGIWNYFGSFYAHAWLWLGDGQKAAKIMYAMANHASLTLVWREEQPVKSLNSREITGDMPHNWASAEFIRMMRNFIVLERGEELHLFEGVPPTWTKPGMKTALKGIYTEFGILDVDLTVSMDGKKAVVNLNLDSTNHKPPSSVVLHLDALKGTGKKIIPKPEFPITETIAL